MTATPSEPHSVPIGIETHGTDQPGPDGVRHYISTHTCHILLLPNCMIMVRTAPDSPFGLTQAICDPRGLSLEISYDSGKRFLAHLQNDMEMVGHQHPAEPTGIP